MGRLTQKREYEIRQHLHAWRAHRNEFPDSPLTIVLVDQYIKDVQLLLHELDKHSERQPLP